VQTPDNPAIIYTEPTGVSNFRKKIPKNGNSTDATYLIGEKRKQIYSA